MWIFTLDGFFSAVQDRGNPDRIMVRARVREDIDRLAERIGSLFATPAPEVLEWAGSDYAFRVFLRRNTWTTYLALVSQEIDYSNFKQQATRPGTARSAVYMAIWSRLMQWQSQEALEESQSNVPEADRWWITEEDSYS